MGKLWGFVGETGAPETSYIIPYQAVKIITIFFFERNLEFADLSKNQAWICIKSQIDSGEKYDYPKDRKESFGFRNETLKR